MAAAPPREVRLAGRTAADLAELDDLRRQIGDYRRRAVPMIDPTPTRLGERLDSLIVRTPALDVMDAQLLRVRDALAVMFERRRLFAELAAQGLETQAATDEAARRLPERGITRLLLSMPPQEGKTTTVSRYGVEWLLRQFPELRVVIVSYDGVNASRISYMSRGDIELFDGSAGNPDLGLRLMKDQRAQSRWRLTTGGDVYAIGIGGGLTGRPVDLLLIDDPVKDDQAASSELRSSQAWLWWMGTGRPRLAPGAPVIVVGTRWHEADLIGRLEAKETEDRQAGLEHYDRWVTVNIPAQADHREGETDVLGRAPGEFMASARGRTRDQWEATKAGTATRLWNALYMGKPSPDEGTVWLTPWWRYYTEPMWTQQPDGSFKVPGVDRLLWSWDMAFKDTDSSDYVCGQLWAKRGAESFLIYAVWARLSFSDTRTAVVRGHGLFPEARPILVEDTANGPAIISSLKKVVPGIVPIKAPSKSKVARAEAVSPFLRAGNVWLPTSGVAVPDGDGRTPHPLVFDPGAFVAEAKSFPFGAHDDQVDAASQALAELYLGVGGPARVERPQGRVPGVDKRVDPAGRLGPGQRILHDRATRR